MLEKAIQMFATKSAFCRAIGMSPQFLYQIETGRRPLPPLFALKIEKETGGKVLRGQLRPDIYPD